MEPGLVSEGFDVRSALRASLVAETGGEGLVEPQVVPPLHGDQVAEPHVAQLVLDHHAEESQLGDRHVLFRAHDLIGVSDAANVFHSTIFIVRAHDVINLGEGVSCAEVLLVEIEGGLGDAKQKFVAQELHKGLSDEDPLGHVHGVVVLEHLIGTSTDGIQVSRNLVRLFKFIDGHLFVTFVEIEEPLDSGALQNVSAVVVSISQLVARLNGIGHGTPLSWAKDDERHLSLQIGLIEAGEHAEAMEGLKLGVQVLLVVGAVRESVQADAVLVVRGQVLELNSVPALDNLILAKRDNLVLVALRSNRRRLVVHAELCHGNSLQVDEQIGVVVGQLVQVKVDLGVSKVIVALLQCELVVVFDLADKFAALGCLLSRENDGGFVFFVDDSGVAEVLDDQQLLFSGGDVLVSLDFLVGFDHGVGILLASVVQK